MWVSNDPASTAFCYAPLVPHPPSANDYMVASALSFARHNCEIYAPPREIWLMHEQPSYLSAYAKYLDAPVRFGTAYNAIVLHDGVLATPMRARNPELAVAFEAKLEELAKGLVQLGSTARRVRETLRALLVGGAVQMSDVARKLGLSEATLRRKRQDEGASFSEILEELRRQAALSYLGRAEPSVSEVASLLGFSDVRAFARAFKRWTGITPTEYREHELARAGQPNGT